MKRISAFDRFEKKFGWILERSKCFKLLSCFRHLSSNYLYWDISHGSSSHPGYDSFQESETDRNKSLLTHKYCSFQTPGPEVGPLPTPVTSNLQIHWAPLLCLQSSEEGTWCGLICNYYGLCPSLGFPSGSEGKESASNVGDPGSVPGLGRSPGEGNSYPVQYSWLENPTGRGTWWAIFQGVAKSWTWLSDCHSTVPSLG